MSDSEKPSLWEQKENELLLRGVECRLCGSIQFPPQLYGCEACGADESWLREKLIPAEGTLRTCTTVHLDQKLETPFQVAEVQTEASQPVRGRLEFPHAKLGSVVRGLIREIEGKERFVFVSKEGGN